MSQPALQFLLSHAVCGTELVGRWTLVFEDPRLERKDYFCPTCGRDVDAAEEFA